MRRRIDLVFSAFLSGKNSSALIEKNTVLLISVSNFSIFNLSTVFLPRNKKIKGQN